MNDEARTPEKQQNDVDNFFDEALIDGNRIYHAYRAEDNYYVALCENGKIIQVSAEFVRELIERFGVKAAWILFVESLTESTDGKFYHIKWPPPSLSELSDPCRLR